MNQKNGRRNGKGNHTQDSLDIKKTGPGSCFTLAIKDEFHWEK